VSDVWVVNASPVIVLAKAGYLRLLERLPSELLLPEPVAAEIRAGPKADPARQAVESGWAKRVPTEAVPAELLEWGLGPGETAVLAVARQMQPCTAILDDAVARNCAKAFHVPLIGTLGVALRAKKRGLVEQAGEVLHALRRAGLHLDDTTIRLALGRIGETWPRIPK
jgi:predicted nucleic acid-binding protein